MIKIGDRVRVNKNYQGEVTGETGTVIDISGTLYPVIVRADDLVDGVKEGYFYPDELDILDEDYPNEVPC